MKVKSIIKNGEERYIIVDENDEHKILDNANGYGYKSYENALRAFNYKNRDKSKDEHFNKVVSWANRHKDFVEAVDDEYSSLNLYLLKGGEKPKGYTNALIKDILEEKNLKLPEDIEIKDLLNYFRSNREPRGLKKNSAHFEKFKKGKYAYIFSEEELGIIKKYNKTAWLINNSKFLDEATNNLITEMKELKKQLSPIKLKLLEYKRKQKEVIKKEKN